jgi:hypothetical protein
MFEYARMELTHPDVIPKIKVKRSGDEPFSYTGDKPRPGNSVDLGSGTPFDVSPSTLVNGYHVATVTFDKANDALGRGRWHTTYNKCGIARLSMFIGDPAINIREELVIHLECRDHALKKVVAIAITAAKAIGSAVSVTARFIAAVIALPFRLMGVAKRRSARIRAGGDNTMKISAGDAS